MTEIDEATAPFTEPKSKNIKQCSFAKWSLLGLSFVF